MCTLYFKYIFHWLYDEAKSDNVILLHCEQTVFDPPSLVGSYCFLFTLPRPKPLMKTLCKLLPCYHKGICPIASV